jgi:hypothetical protein
MTYQHEFVMKLNAEYEERLEFTVCAVLPPNRWVFKHVRLKKPHAQTTQLLKEEGVESHVVVGRRDEACHFPPRHSNTLWHRLHPHDLLR